VVLRALRAVSLMRPRAQLCDARTWPLWPSADIRIPRWTRAIGPVCHNHAWILAPAPDGPGLVEKMLIFPENMLDNYEQRSGSGMSQGCFCALDPSGCVARGGPIRCGNRNAAESLEERRRFPRAIGRPMRAWWQRSGRWVSTMKFEHGVLMTKHVRYDFRRCLAEG